MTEVAVGPVGALAFFPVLGAVFCFEGLQLLQLSLLKENRLVDGIGLEWVGGFSRLVRVVYELALVALFAVLSKVCC